MPFHNRYPPRAQYQFFKFHERLLTDDGYLIAGWLNVQKAIQAATLLLPVIEKEMMLSSRMPPE
jgi:hypothetical protein